MPVIWHAKKIPSGLARNSRTAFYMVYQSHSIHKDEALSHYHSGLDRPRRANANNASGTSTISIETWISKANREHRPLQRVLMLSCI